MQLKQDASIKTIRVLYDTDSGESLAANTIDVFFNTDAEAEAFAKQIEKRPDNQFFYTRYYPIFKNEFGCRVRLDLGFLGPNKGIRADRILKYLDSKYVLPSEFIISYPFPKYSLDDFKEILLPLSKGDWIELLLDELLDRVELRNSKLTENLSQLIGSEVNVDIVQLKSKTALEITCSSSEQVINLKRIIFNRALDHGVDAKFHFKSVVDHLGTPYENKFLIKIHSGFNFHELLEDLVNLNQTPSSSYTI